MALSDKIVSIIKQFQQQEISGYHVYKKISDIEKEPKNKRVLQQISDDEKRHYDIYKKYTKVDVNPSRFAIFWYSLLGRLLGPTFAIKLLEKDEAAAQTSYSELLDQMPEIKRIIEDEEQHELKLIGLIEEERINYMGSVVLGLNDALVELTGALAGFTFALQNPKLIALTGSITGIAAAFSMAASEYLSTKSEDQGKHALKASVYTGIAYLGTVILLILPYLLFSNVYFSLGMTLATAVLIIAAFNYYYAVVKDEKFKRRFFEMFFLSLGVALISFGIGLVLRKFFGIEI